MLNWAPLWSGIVDSSLWDEPDHVRIVFVTMLALKDSGHVYSGSAYKLAQRAKKTEVEVLDALRILSSPDTRRLEKQEFDGRRIQAVEDGWLILNGEKYQEEMQAEIKRARDRKSQQAARERRKLMGLKSGGGATENAAVEAERNGDTALANRLSTPVHQRDAVADEPEGGPPGLM